MNTNSYCIAVILYKPNADVWSRIRIAAEAGYKVLLFDNSPGLSLLPPDILDTSSTEYLTLGNNSGIGEALLRLCRAAVSRGYERLLYFDQDTIFDEQTLRFIEDVGARIMVPPAEAGMGPEPRLASITFRDRPSVTVSRTRRVGDVDLQVVDFTINSGSLFDLKALERIGWHDPGFFIDGVDYAYCLAAARAGYLIGEIAETPGLNHSSEQDDSRYSFFGYNFSGRRYPKYRRKDFYRSSFRLIRDAMGIDARRASWLFRSLVFYWIVQTIIPFSKKVVD